MQTDISYSEPSSRGFERGTATSAEWSNWTTNQIRSAIEDERERTFALLSELLALIQRETIPEVVARLPELRGPAGPVGPAGKLPIAKEWQREKVYYEGQVVTYDGATYQAVHDTGEGGRMIEHESAAVLSRQLIAEGGGQQDPAFLVELDQDFGPECHRTFSPWDPAADAPRSGQTDTRDTMGYHGIFREAMPKTGFGVESEGLSDPLYCGLRKILRKE